MKTNLSMRNAECGMRKGQLAPRALLSALLIAFILQHSSLIVSAFPPAPHHLLFGLVRDEYGNPLTGTASIILESASGVKVLGELVPNRSPGVNYQLKVPMDAGLTSDVYKPTALRPSVPFKIKVRIGTVDYLPIEMLGNFKQLGEAGKDTRLDLTLGEDLDGDGLPDAWERAMIAAGHGTSLSDINPNGDTDRDGLTNLQEYVAGTYAFDPENGFALKINGVSEGRPILEFLSIRGRTYNVQSSSDLKNWGPVRIRVKGEEASRENYLATDVRMMEVEAEPADTTTVRFYRLLVR